MRFPRVIIACCLLVLIGSCAKENINPLAESGISEYSQLKVGNQWIYATYYVDRDGTEKFRTNDTVSIVGDTIISGQQYFIESCSFDGDRCSRLIYQDENAIKLFPSEEVIFSLDSTLTYRHFETGGSPDTLVITDSRLAGKSTVLVPAGDFETFEFSGEAKSQVNSSIVYPKSFYASGVGLVLKICPFLNGQGNRFEQRLSSFKVGP